MSIRPRRRAAPFACFKLDLRQFQRGDRWAEGIARGSGVGQTMQSLTTPFARRGLDRLWAAGRSPPRTPMIFPTSIYRLRAAARWHDGKPVAQEASLFSFDALKKNSPLYPAPITGISSNGEKAGERDVKFTFDAPGNRELPSIAGELPVLAKHWWEGNERTGPKARCRCDHAGDSAGVGALSHQGVQRRTVGGAGTRDRLLGQEISRPPESDRIISTRSGMNSFATTPWASKTFKADQLDWHAESAAASNGRWPMIFRPCAKSASSRKNLPITARGGCRDSCSTCAGPLFADVRLRRAFNLAYDWEDIGSPAFER